jgi:acylphosphatase
MSNRLSLHLKISGRVQGVYYRDFTSRHALRLKLTGWVRNLPDGTVEVIAEGEKKHLLEFITVLKQGPPASQVADVGILWQECTNSFHDFQIIK